MSPTRFTPGPWKVTRVESGASARRRTLVYARIDAGSHGPLAGVTRAGASEAVTYRDPNHERSDAETMANARLIAAAPDLLVFARLVARLETNAETEARTGDQQSGDDAVEALSGLIHMARAAIAKAEGGE